MNRYTSHTEMLELDPFYAFELFLYEIQWYTNCQNKLPIRLEKGFAIAIFGNWEYQTFFKWEITFGVRYIRACLKRIIAGSWSLTFINRITSSWTRSKKINCPLFSGYYKNNIDC
ncbi:MAG: hypothetical protein KBA66_05415 [Leptospiraceae bacterium]|nr:hypothetical protein [Leptospiraceae bacterium]